METYWILRYWKSQAAGPRTTLGDMNNPLTGNLLVQRLGRHIHDPEAYGNGSTAS